MFRYERINYKIYILLLLLFIALFIVGSFFDLNISNALYNNDSRFGLMFTVYGSLPLWFLLTICGVVLFKVSILDQRWHRKIYGSILGIIVFLFSVTLNVYCVFFMCPEIVKIFTMSFRIVLIVLFQSISVICVWKLTDNNDRRYIRRNILFMLRVIFSSMLLTLILSLIWKRPSFYLISNGLMVNGYYFPVESIFRDWYRIGSGISREIFPDAKTIDFMSFPSIAMTNAATGMTLFYIPIINMKCKIYARFSNTILLIGFLWSCFVGFSQLLYGRAYLTDIAMGFLITIIFMMLYTRIFLAMKKVKNNNATINETKSI
jgi:CAS/CSE protein involved in chromosome segregation